MEYKEYNWDYLNKKAYNNTIGKYRTEIELKFPLVVFFATLERKLGLYKWYSQSPWMLIYIKKSTKIFK